MELDQIIDNTVSFTFKGTTHKFTYGDNNLISQVADKYILNGQAEDFLLNLKKLSEAIELVDKATRAELLKTFQDTTKERTGSVTSDRVVVSIAETGTKYYIEQDRIDEVPSNMYKVKTTYSVDTKEVEKYLKEHGSLPLGINKSQNRNLSVTIKERKNMLLDMQPPEYADVEFD